MSPFQTQIARWLTVKNVSCPICNSTDFGIMDSPFGFTKLKVDDWKSAGFIVALARVDCANCAHAMFFNMQIMGFTPPS